MEHLLHLFGGGCGEHMLWPMLLASVSGAGVWLRAKLPKKREKDEV